MNLIHAQVTISPLPGMFARINRQPRTFEVSGLHSVACKQRALDMYGDYCEVTGYREFDPNYPPQPYYNGDDDAE